MSARPRRGRPSLAPTHLRHPTTGQPPRGRHLSELPNQLPTVNPNFRRDIAGSALSLVDTRPDHKRELPILGALPTLLAAPSTGQTLREKGTVLRCHGDRVMGPIPGLDDLRWPRQSRAHAALPSRVSVCPMIGISFQRNCCAGGWNAHHHQSHAASAGSRVDCGLIFSFYIPLARPLIWRLRWQVQKSIS